MKKVITLVLAIALVLTSVVALADGTPNINSFATMKVKYHELKKEPWGAPAYWEITLSKPVDRLLINWSGKGEEPEELAVDENLKATALKGNHKYMPGTTQYYATWVKATTIDMDEEPLGYDVLTSEKVYDVSYQYDSVYSKKPSTTTFFPWRELTGTTEEDLEAEIEAYKKDYETDDDNYVVEYPYIDADGNFVPGVIYAIEYSTYSVSTVQATPLQTAFMTVQGEWAVYYNRAGRIVGIEKFDGQF